LVKTMELNNLTREMLNLTRIQFII
jgi:hypothetical protein